MIPPWAIRLLVLALILPVLGATIDGLARARRRGHSVLAWIAVGLARRGPVRARARARRCGSSSPGCSAAPPGPGRAGAVPLRGAGIAVLIDRAAVVLALVGFAPACSAALSGGRTGARRGPGGAGARPRCCSSCVWSSLVIWVANPFAAGADRRPRCTCGCGWSRRRCGSPRRSRRCAAAGGAGAAGAGGRLLRAALGLGPIGRRWNGSAADRRGRHRRRSPALDWSVVLGLRRGRRRDCRCVRPATASAGGARRSPCAARSLTRARARWAGPSRRCGDEHVLDTPAVASPARSGCP